MEDLEKKEIEEQLAEFFPDADFDSHSIDVQNGEGYYDDCGHYVSYHKE